MVARKSHLAEFGEFTAQNLANVAWAFDELCDEYQPMPSVAFDQSAWVVQNIEAQPLANLCERNTPNRALFLARLRSIVADFSEAVPNSLDSADWDRYR